MHNLLCQDLKRQWCNREEAVTELRLFSNKSATRKWPRPPSFVPTWNRAFHVSLHLWKLLFLQAEKLYVIVPTNDIGPSFSTLKKPGDPWLWSTGGQEKDKQDERQFPLTKPISWKWGSPHWSDSWCLVLENQTVETFPCHILYCLLHLGQGFSFRGCGTAHVGQMLAVRAVGHLPFKWRSRFKTWFWKNIHPAAESLRITLSCWLCTWWKGARSGKTETSELLICLFVVTSTWLQCDLITAVESEQ